MNCPEPVQWIVMLPEVGARRQRGLAQGGGGEYREGVGEVAEWQTHSTQNRSPKGWWVQVPPWLVADAP